MRLLLLGANGQLGTDLIRASAGFPGVQIIPLQRTDVDITELASIPTALAPHSFDALINCTSYHKTDEVESNADKAVKINAHAVKAIAEVCREKRARLLHVSTDYVFSGMAHQPYRESDAPGPLNVYGATKLLGENLARLVHADTLIFRVASLFGVAGASGKGGNFVETMLRFGKEKGLLKVVSDQVMSPTGTADVADMILKALTRNIPAGVYHAVNSGQASWYEFAAQIIDRAGVNAKVEPIPATAYPVPARRPAFSVLDNSRLASLIGPIPQWTTALDNYLRAKGHLAAVAAK